MTSAVDSWPPCRKVLEARGWKYGDMPSFGFQFSKPGVGCVIRVSEGYYCWERYTVRELSDMGRSPSRGFFFDPCAGCTLASNETCSDRGCNLDLDLMGAVYILERLAEEKRRK